ncbi:lipopolysaccharide biosynthesis protein [Lacticaseibacillus paracasei]|uniref:lipopolysaccharide biosynthesis protein n=1 Tax=Lacticaseibacillus paracasei TaxID=1597 RepID=UPI0025A1C415|nr:oligosaccharide flippase family protein [Lacticaseibacillus paracasei]MDM7530316.1 oligosaccharide flippase family protein [Lacticaseibacillus paracasei]MDM7542636.1 oligosaccharide flippase family protein [Lacticaseibacillus paracasei]
MKNENSRLLNSMRNIINTAFVFVITMVFTLVVRMFLSRTMGQTYVGLTGVLTSVVASFSLTDLGIDSVFVFLLYKPLADHDHAQLSALVRLFRKVYVIIGSAFITIGLIAIPFLHLLIGKQAMNLPHIYLIYVLFMLNTGLSYFFSYYRIVLNADQRYYVIARITLIVTAASNIAQIVSLILFKNFIVYVACLLISTLMINLVIAVIVRSRYPSMRRISAGENHVSLHVKEVLKRNTIGGISNKIGSLVVFSSDNILLANFTTLSIVGMYSNYSLITQGIASFVSKVISSITATIGNLGTEQNVERNSEVFISLSFGMNTLILVITLPLLLVFNAFMRFWIGSGSLLSSSAVLLIVINAMLQLARYPSLTFIDAFGLQWIQRWKSVIEALINLLVSLILLAVFHLGLEGVLLGTLASNIFVVTWYEPYIVLRETSGRQYVRYCKELVVSWILFFLELGVGAVVLHFGFSQGKTSLAHILIFVILLLITYLVCWVFLHNNKNFKYYQSLILQRIRRS